VTDPALTREVEYHNRLYSGFAQQHFARPAVRAFRADLVSHIFRVTGIGRDSRILSLGCGIGDTELLLAPHVNQITGIDLSPAAIRQARLDAQNAGIENAKFVEGQLESAELAINSFDLVLGIFFLHHLSDAALKAIPLQIHKFLAREGKFYALDPSRRRLSGAIGSLLFPALMRKYQSPGERELDAEQMAELFRAANFECTASFYDFLSTPLGGLLPGWRSGYRAARYIDDALIRLPLVRKLGSNFELVAKTRI